jgi:hypothetical protein
MSDKFTRGPQVAQQRMVSLISLLISNVSGHSRSNGHNNCENEINGIPLWANFYLIVAIYLRILVRLG